MDKYIYHTKNIKAKIGYVDFNEVIQKWINSNPYPKYKLFQLNLTSNGHQSVWKLKEDRDINKIIEKYNKRKINIINPDSLTWEDIGFDEPDENYKDVNDYLENSDGAYFDGGQQTEIRMIDEFIEDLKNLETY